MLPNLLGDAADVVAASATLADRLARLPAAADPPVVFPSPTGLLRDPNNTSGDLRRALDRAGFDRVTSHVFCKTVATRLDEGRETLRYLTGLLIFLGLLGTFWGLLETVGSIGSVINALQGNADSTLMFEDLKNGIARPLAGSMRSTAPGA